MKIVIKESKAELEVKKSKFICHTKPVKNEEEAKDFVKNITKEHRKATHNVPIYLIGKDYAIQKYSDDGEPAGTAGLPVLRMLINEEVFNIAMVITRYFGGIKLGKGGLVRAYTNSAKLGIEASNLSEILNLRKVKFNLEYSIQNKFVYEMASKFKFYEDEIDYSDFITYSYYLLNEDIDEFVNFMTELCLGKFSLIENIEVSGILLNGKIKQID